MTPSLNRLFKKCIAFIKTEGFRNLTAFGALIISLITLIYTVNKINNDLRPILFVTVGESHVCRGYYGFVLSNVGLGPATVNSITITCNGTKVLDKADFERSITRELIAMNINNIVPRSESIRPGLILGTGQEMILYGIESERFDNPAVLDTILKKCSITIKYSSVNHLKYRAEFPVNEPQE
jgi:hypothetical protein